MAAGEEGAIGIARRPSGAPDQGQPCPLSCIACSCSASPRLSWWRRFRLWSTRASSPRRFSTLRRKSACSPIRSCFADPDFWQAFWTTIAIAGGMAAIAVPLGAVLAFLMVRTDVPGRRYLEPLILIPIFVSAVVIAFGYVVAIGPVGILSTLAKDILGFVPWNLYSLLALIMIAGLTHVPHVYLYSAAALRGLSTDLEEAARVSGANPFRVARQRQPADDPAGDPVCRRARVLSGLRAVRPAAGAGRSAGSAGALDLSVQAHQQARRAVISADGRGRGCDHRDHRTAGVHAAPAAAPGATLCVGARQGPARRSRFRSASLALGRLCRNRSLARS